MNKFESVQTSFLSKSLLILAFLASFSIFSENFVTGNAETEVKTNVTIGNLQTPVWGLKEIRIFKNMDGNLGSVVRERYDKNGGEVEINIKSNAHICPGGSEVARFTWRFVDDASQVRSGGGLGISVQAEQKSSSRPCTTELSSRSFISVKANGISSGDYSSSERSRIDFDRFEDNGEGVRAYPAGAGERAAFNPLKVTNREINPNKPLAALEIVIGTPTQSGGGILRYAYVYELGGGSNGGGGEASTPDLAGNWESDFQGRWSPTSVRQEGNKLWFTNEFGNTSEGSFQSPTRVKATQWEGGLGATIQNNGNTIKWDNGTTWRRRQ